MHGTENMVACVADAIATQNPQAAMRFTKAFKTSSTDPSGQISDLNRYWRTELSSLHSSTVSERTCLINDIEPRDWLRHFKELVLPLIIKSDLPRG